MIADCPMPNCESAILNPTRYLVTLQNSLLQVLVKTERAVCSRAQKRPFVFVIEWQEHEQCLFSQSQRRGGFRSLEGRRDFPEVGVEELHSLGLEIGGAGSEGFDTSAAT